MNYWLFKEEPSHYSYAELERDGRTEWEGIANPLALIYLRQVKKGDQIFFYHTGKEKSVVGIMVALSNAKQGNEPKDVKVAVKAVKYLKRQVSLKEMKSQPALADWELTRNSRLSIMPVTPKQWQAVLALANTTSQEQRGS